MPVIDVHAHVTPDRYKEAIRTTGSWHGLGPEAGELNRAGFNTSLPDRLAEMDAMGVDVQLITPTVGFYQYDKDLAVTSVVARDCNDAIAEIVEQHPDRFAGLGITPMQDVPSTIAEMERVVRDLGLKGVVIGDHVNGHTYDEPGFLPFFRAAEDLGAIVFFHQGKDTCVQQRISRYSLPNAVGNLTDRTLTFATLVFGGVMDACPDLKPLLAHGGGYAAFGAGRLDKVAGAFEGGYPDGPLTPPFGAEWTEKLVITRPPSTYLPQFHYDCCTYDGPALRFVIDTVGIDRVMLGTDYPAPMFLKDPVRWVNGLDVLTDAEKQAILSDNAAALLDL
ncbi:MAG: amidohydrolase family protein [Propionibacteriales bacterium]|nr:amidohydrolase family protein [Propionibacteriales bacterium]